MRVGIVLLAGLLLCGVAAAAQPTDIVKAGAKVISVNADFVTVGSGGVWERGKSSDFFRLDPKTGRVLKRIRVPQGLCEEPISAFGALWSSTCTKPGIVRIDPRTNALRWAPLPKKAALNDGAMIGAGGGTLWVMLDGQGCSACELARISPRTMAVVGTVHVPDGSLSVRFGYGYAFLTNPSKNTVQQIDPRTNAVVKTARVPGAPGYLAVGEKGVWVLGRESGDVTRIDPKRGSVVKAIHAHVVADRGFNDMATGAGWVWAAGQGYVLTRIDPKTNTVVEQYGPSLGSGAVAVGYGAVWIASGTSYRLPVSKI